MKLSDQVKELEIFLTEKSLLATFLIILTVFLTTANSNSNSQFHRLNLGAGYVTIAFLFSLIVYHLLEKVEKNAKFALNFKDFKNYFFNLNYILLFFTILLNVVRDNVFLRIHKLFS